MYQPLSSIVFLLTEALIVSFSPMCKVDVEVLGTLYLSILVFFLIRNVLECKVKRKNLSN